MTDNTKFPTVFDEIKGYTKIMLTAPLVFADFKADTGDIIAIDSAGVWHIVGKTFILKEN